MPVDINSVTGGNPGTFRMTCPACAGVGFTDSQRPCLTCRGSGQVTGNAAEFDFPTLSRIIGSAGTMPRTTGRNIPDSGHVNADYTSDDRAYLYRRWAQWNIASEPVHRDLIVCLFAPSAEYDDDHLARRAEEMARVWGASGVDLVYLFARRGATIDEIFADGADPIGPDNTDEILNAADECRSVVCAWGNLADTVLLERAASVRRMLLGIGKRLTCLGYNDNGTPKNPLHVRVNIERVPYPLPRPVIVPPQVNAPRPRRRSARARTPGRAARATAATAEEGGGADRSNGIGAYYEYGLHGRGTVEDSDRDDAVLCDGAIYSNPVGVADSGHPYGVFFFCEGAWIFSPTFAGAARHIGRHHQEMPAIHPGRIFAAARNTGTVYGHIIRFPEDTVAMNRRGVWNIDADEGISETTWNRLWIIARDWWITTFPDAHSARRVPEGLEQWITARRAVIARDAMATVNIRNGGGIRDALLELDRRVNSGEMSLSDAINTPFPAPDFGSTAIRNAIDGMSEQPPDPMLPGGNRVGMSDVRDGDA